MSIERRKALSSFRFAIIAIAMAIPSGAMVWFFVGPPRMWISYVGQTEEEITRALGPAGYNERTQNPHPGEDRYLLWWPYSIGGRMCVEFDQSGRAVAQYRNGK